MVRTRSKAAAEKAPEAIDKTAPKTEDYASDDLHLLAAASMSESRERKNLAKAAAPLLTPISKEFWQGASKGRHV
jgi:hypothetical protein